MKKTKILVPAMAVLALGMAAAVTGTVAWFSANNVVTASGMMFKSITPSSLAIGKDLTSGGIGQATAIEFDPLLEDPDTHAPIATSLSPTSHWHGSEGTQEQFYRVTNGEFIDPNSGLALEVAAAGDGVTTIGEAPNQKHYKTITYSDPLASGSGYYLDYVCYIASVGEGITIGTNGKLTATPTITSAGGNGATLQAATIDFVVYKGATFNINTNQVVDNAATYVQGVNKAGVDYTDGRHATYPKEVEFKTTAKTSSDLLGAADYIPAAASGDAIKVVMRFYFDGALLNSDSSTYVATNTLDVSDLNVVVSFSLDRGN